METPKYNTYSHLLFLRSFFVISLLITANGFPLILKMQLVTNLPIFFYSKQPNYLGDELNRLDFLKLLTVHLILSNSFILWVPPVIVSPYLPLSLYVLHKIGRQEWHQFFVIFYYKVLYNIIVCYISDSQTF